MRDILFFFSKDKNEFEFDFLLNRVPVPNYDIQKISVLNISTQTVFTCSSGNSVVIQPK